MKRILLIFVLLSGLTFGQDIIKISQLPTALSASAHDYFAIVQNGVTKKVKFKDFWASIKDSINTSVFVSNVTLYNNSAPTLRSNGDSLQVGDLWIESDNFNRQYRWSGSNWVSIKDWEGDWDYLGNIPSPFTPPAGKGLYVTSAYMGYYDSLQWKTYIANDGSFYFKGDSTNYISWNGLSLDVRGNLNADDINAGTINGITIISTDFLTRATGSRLQINAEDNNLYWYQNAETQPTGYITALRSRTEGRPYGIQISLDLEVTGDIYSGGTTASDKVVLYGGLSSINVSTFTNDAGYLTSLPSHNNTYHSETYLTAVPSNYAGGSSIATVGTITSGTWNGNAIGDSYISSASTWNGKSTVSMGSESLLYTIGSLNVFGRTLTINGTGYTVITSIEEI